MNIEQEIYEPINTMLYNNYEGQSYQCDNKCKNKYTEQAM